VAAAAASVASVEDASVLAVAMASAMATAGAWVNDESTLLGFSYAFHTEIV